jgi:inner membrane protein
MDTVTHIVLGAAIGEVLAGEKLGKKALLIGAIAANLPDIDFVASFWLDSARDVWFHRGITHSLLFVVVISLLLAWVARRVDGLRWRGDGLARRVDRSGRASRLAGRASRSTAMTFGQWWLFFGVQLLVHIFIDAFNAYGTGWFEPFNSYRVTFNVLFVADPLYSCWLGIAFLALLILRRDSPARKRWARFGLVLSSVYLCFCLVNKWRIDRVVERQLRQQAIPYARFFTTPTPLNSLLWYVVATDSNGDEYTGYRSVFDAPGRPIVFRLRPRGDSLVRGAGGGAVQGGGDGMMQAGSGVVEQGGGRDVGYLLRFAQGYYTIERWGDTLVFNVPRFGEVRGWDDPGARFVFHYYLNDPGHNGMVVQRGRLAGWDRKAWRDFIRRIGGEDVRGWR